MCYRFLSNVIGIGRWEAKLVHHPISFGAFSSTSTIVNERLLEANALTALPSVGIHGLVYASGLPKPGPSYSIWPDTVLVLPPSLAVKVPLFISHVAAPICMPTAPQNFTILFP